jgi:hypothetical protein
VQQQLKATDRSFGSTAYIPYRLAVKTTFGDRPAARLYRNAQVTARTVDGKAAFPVHLFNPLRLMAANVLQTFSLTNVCKRNLAGFARY